MIRHIVAFRLKATDAEQCRQDADGIRARLEALVDVVPGIDRLEVHNDLGLVHGHWPVVLVGDYVDNDALEAYQSHPRHVEAATWVGGLIAERAVIDYELPRPRP